MRTDHRTLRTAAVAAMISLSSSIISAQAPRWELTSHSRAVSALELGANDSILVTAGYDGELVVWDAISKTKRSTFRVPGVSSYLCSAFSLASNGRAAAMSTELGLFQVDLQTGEYKRITAEPDIVWTKLSYSGDSVAYVNARGRLTWERAGLVIDTISLPKDIPGNWPFYDHPRYAAADDLKVYFADDNDIRFALPLLGKQTAIPNVKYDGLHIGRSGSRLLASSWDSTSVYDLTSGTKLIGVDDPAATLSTNGRSVYSQYRGLIDLETGNVLKAIEPKETDRYALAADARLFGGAVVVADGVLIPASGRVRGYDTASAVWTTLGTMPAPPSVAFFDRSGAIITTEGLSIRRRDVLGNTVIEWTLDWPFNGFTGREITTDRRLLSAFALGNDMIPGVGGPMVFSMEALVLVASLRVCPACTIYAYNTDISPDGDKILWGQQLLPLDFKEYASPESSEYRFTGSGEEYVTLSGREMSVYESSGGAFSRTVMLPFAARKYAFFRGGNLLALFDSNSSVHLLEWPSVDVRRSVLIGHRSVVHHITFSPNGRYAFTSSADSTIRGWEIATGAEVFQLRNTAAVRHLDLSPDQKLIVACVGEGLALWDVPGVLSAPMLDRAESPLRAAMRAGSLELHLNRKGSAALGQVVVLNTLGAELYRGAWTLQSGDNARDVSLPSLTPGVYFVRVDLEGERLFARFLISAR